MLVQPCIFAQVLYSPQQHAGSSPTCVHSLAPGKPTGRYSGGDRQLACSGPGLAHGGKLQLMCGSCLWQHTRPASGLSPLSLVFCALRTAAKGAGYSLIRGAELTSSVPCQLCMCIACLWRWVRPSEHALHANRSLCMAICLVVAGLRSAGEEDMLSDRQQDLHNMALMPDGLAYNRSTLCSTGPMQPQT